MPSKIRVADTPRPAAPTCSKSEAAAGRAAPFERINRTPRALSNPTKSRVWVATSSVIEVFAGSSDWVSWGSPDPLGATSDQLVISQTPLVPGAQLHSCGPRAQGLLPVQVLRAA